MQIRLTRSVVATLALSSWPALAVATSECPPSIQQFLAGKAIDVVCFHSDDLRTNSAETTPPDSSITTFADGTALPGALPGVTVLGLPRTWGSYLPRTDRGVISNGPTPTTQAVPGIQAEGWFADDPAGQARFVLRFPDNWNGKLVVAGSSGTRSEFNGDWAWSDYVLPKGYAYASQNKGVLNFHVVNLGSVTQPANDPQSCRASPPGFGSALSTLWIHYYDVDADKPFTEWTQYMLKTAELAQDALKAHYNAFARRTYAVGTSNGGYQVVRAIEEAPHLFDGGVAWEPTYIDPYQNVLVNMPVALKNFPIYAAANYDPKSDAAKNILNAGFPPDIVHRNGAGAVTDSLWRRYYNDFWEATVCQWQLRFDPTYPTYSAGPANYDYLSRLTPEIARSVEAVTTTGKIKKPLVAVSGSMDAQLPHHALAYEAAVNDSRKGNNAQRNAQYRLYEVQNGNHIESYVTPFPELVVIQPHAQKAFDLLVDHVEKNAALPPSQCIPKGGTISSSPPQAGNCAQLLAP